ncbi:MAG: dihydrodipicolinate synthase family protein, partial [Acidobacteriota bacterium]|nr:dihydrodipicolinate synthase family protein [Acidobacteriota bacterium]
ALLDTGRFAGIKDSSGDREYLSQLLALRRDHPFALFAGNDRLASHALAGGVDGIVSGCASAIPELLVALYRDPARRDELQSRLDEFIEQIERFPTPIGVKRATELRGQKSGEFATPLSPESETALFEFSAWFGDWWPAVERLL